MTQTQRDPNTGRFVSRRAAKDRAQATGVRATLERLTAEIGAYPAGASMDNLIRQLREVEGMAERPTSEGRIYVQIAGIEAGARGSVEAAVRNWGNAARRKLNAMA